MSESVEKDIPVARTKVRRRQPEEVKARVLAAALDAFAIHGFEGASTRDIAKAAHVSISLLLYHFQTKDLLWRAVISELREKMSLQSIPEVAGKIGSASSRLRIIIETIVRSFAELPALHRLMTLEAHQPSERLIWMCDTFIKDEYLTMCQLIVEGQKEGEVRDISPAQLRFAITAIAAVPFAVSAEYQYLTSRNPFSASEIKNSIDFINRIVFIDAV